MHSASRCSLIAFLAFASSASFGQNPAPVFSSREAKEAQARYISEERKLEAEFQSKRTELRTRYIAELDAAKLAATRTTNLEEAVKIREEIDRTKLNPPILSSKEKFTAELADSAWIEVKSGNAVAFKSDHTIKANWHTEAGLWVVTGERSAAVLMTKNRFVQIIAFDKAGLTFTDREGNVYRKVK